MPARQSRSSRPRRSARGGALRFAAAALVLLCAQATHAYGGLWSPRASRQSAAAVLLIDRPDGTITTVVQLRFEGEAQELAWVIPVRGAPVVELSSSTVLQRLDAATAPQYWLETGAGQGCADGPATPAAPSDLQPGTIYGEGEGEGASGSVTRLDHGTVAPYEHVTIAVATDAPQPAAAAVAWLEEHGFATRGLERAVLEPYLADGYDLLAFKLQPTRRADGVRPIAITHRSESLSLPLRPGAGTADAVGLTVWVVGPSQAICANCPSLVLNSARIDWLSARPFPAGTLPEGGAGPAGAGGYRPSNYDALVEAAVVEAGGIGFVTELAGPTSQYREQVWWSVDRDLLTDLVERSYEHGVDAVVAAAEHYGQWDGFHDAVAAATALDPDGVQALLDDPDAHRDVEVDAAAFMRALQDDVVQPVADAAALLGEGPYLTRLYSRVGLQADTLDPTLGYNDDLAQVGNVHVARQVSGCGADGAWEVQTPQGAVIVGEGDGRWPADGDAMPANLKVVMLGDEGPGEVLVDNGASIAAALEALGGGTRRPTTQTPLDGVPIGGRHVLVAHGSAETRETAAGGDQADRAKPAGAALCATARAGGARASGCVLAPLVLAALLWVRRRPRAPARARAALLFCAGATLPGCVEGGSAGAAAGATLAMDPQELRDPETCKDCHPKHYREWSGSMHAYAAMDPVFLAMNRRGQRETDGELGDFCIRCHAPMAVVDGLSRDGLDLEELPDLERGVSCYYCHNVVGIEDDHNAALTVAGDAVMRGPLDDAIAPPVHGVEYSELLDGSSARSSDMCGACHDIVTPSGVRLERTYQEYLKSVYSKVAPGDPRPFETCLSCHMGGRRGFAAASAGVPEREVHEHFWAGVDLALVDFPHRQAMRSAVEDCQLATSIGLFSLEVTPPDLFTFQIETGAGHNMPSGAAQDRRLWLEFLAYDEDGELLEAVSSGRIADGAIEQWPSGHPDHDPHLLMLRDRIFDAAGDPVHMFWEAEPSEAYPDGYVAQTLPPATTTYLRGKHAIVKQYRASTPDGRLPSRVTARLRMRPIGRDVLQDLVESGDLDPAIMERMQTLDVGSPIEWTPEDGLMTPIVAQDEGRSDCNGYACMLDPGLPECD